MLCTIVNNFRTVAHQNNRCYKILSVYSQHKLSSKSIQFVDKTGGNEQKKKKTVVPNITLITQDDNISITTLEDAQKLSKRRDLKLVKIVDHDMKTQRPVYKLMSGSEYLAEDLKQREKRKIDKVDNVIKGEKLLILSSGITEHDLIIQVSKVLKWLNKQYEVRVVINGVATNMEKAEMIYKFVESQILSAGRIVQKRTKGTDLKFQILPPKKDKEIQKNL